MEPERVELTVVNSALLEAPVFEQHFRGQNWLAIIGIDPSCPGGLSRHWLPKANGGGYVVGDLSLRWSSERTTRPGPARNIRTVGTG